MEESERREGRQRLGLRQQRQKISLARARHVLKVAGLELAARLKYASGAGQQHREGQ